MHRFHPAEEIEFQANLSQYIDTSLIIDRQ